MVTVSYVLGGDGIEKVYLDLTLQRLSLKRNDYKKIPSGNKNYVWIKVTASPDWNGSDIYIQFSKCGTVSEKLLIDGECQVPDWYMAEPGEFYMTAYAGDLKTVNAITVEVSESGYITGEPPEPPQGKTYVTTEDDKISSLRETDGGFQYYSEKEKEWKEIQASSALRYTHVQDELSTEWNVQHNLGELYVEAIILDDTGNEVECEIDYPNSTINLLVIKCYMPMHGKALIKY